ncbi:protein ripply3 isoform X2 [Turdus rufiventris]|nr:protein ripply3 isoform X2 [Turdus rufiventris]
MENPGGKKIRNCGDPTKHSTQHSICSLGLMGSDCPPGINAGIAVPKNNSVSTGNLSERQGEPELDGQVRNCKSKGALGFQHPVRLYLPKSKSQKFLANIGEKVLASFPVQATIHFYNDDAESEEEEVSPERPKIHIKK